MKLTAEQLRNELQWMRSNNCSTSAELIAGHIDAITAERDALTANLDFYNSPTVDELREFLTTNWPDLSSVDAFPISRAIFQLRRLQVDLSRWQQIADQMAVEMIDVRYLERHAQRAAALEAYRKAKA